MTAGHKREAVLRILRSEPLEIVARDWPSLQRIVKVDSPAIGPKKTAIAAREIG